MTATPDPAVTTHGLTKSFGSNRAVNGAVAVLIANLIDFVPDDTYFGLRAEVPDDAIGIRIVNVTLSVGPVYVLDVDPFPEPGPCGNAECEPPPAQAVTNAKAAMVVSTRCMIRFRIKLLEWRVPGKNAAQPANAGRVP